MHLSSRVSPTSSALAPERNAAASGAARADSARAGGEAATNTQLSKPARLLSKLSQLRDSTPEQLSEVVSGVAADLRDVAARDSGMSATMLTALASRLDGIAGGGGLSPARPVASAEAADEAPNAAPAGRPSAAAEATGGASAGARAAAARAYQASGGGAGSGGDAAHAAVLKMLDDLAAAVEATSSSER